MDIISFGVIVGAIVGIAMCLMSSPTDPPESGRRIRGTFAKLRKFRG